MPTRIGCWTDAGRRRTNQDAAISAAIDEDTEVAALADGMGGHAGGEIASQQALHALVAALRGGADLQDGVRAANRVVYRQANESPKLQGMGTTLVVYLRRGDRYEVANVGDSRAYLIEDGAIRLLTRDHSFMAEAVASGELTEEEARLSPWRNALTRAIGTDPEVEVDLFGPFDVTPGQTILLSSDGFHRWVLEEEVCGHIAVATELQTAAAALGEAALQGGSDDNVTVMLIEVGAPALMVGAALPERRPGRSSQLQKNMRRWRRLDFLYFSVVLVVLLICLASLVVLVR
jgi:protein phosphatase